MIIKQPILLVGVFLLLILVAFAFSYTKKTKQNLLWEITSPKTKEKSYLFGTIHLIEKEFFKLPNLLKDKIKNSSVVLFEIPYPSHSNLQDLMILKDEKTCMDFFSDYEKDKIYAWSEKYLKLNKEEFRESYNKFKPFVLAQTITQHAFLDNTVSYEQEIYHLIKNTSINVYGLETVEEQIQLLESIPLEIQKKQIIQAIDSFEVNKSTLKNMQMAYKKQDLITIYNWIIKESKDVNYPITKFLDERNLNWLPKITKQINQKSAFIAVGSGHLAGPNGLIQLLKNQGYKVKSIFIK